jgi:hypothetical protein
MVVRTAALTMVPEPLTGTEFHLHTSSQPSVSHCINVLNLTGKYPNVVMIEGARLEGRLVGTIAASE